MEFHFTSPTFEFHFVPNESIAPQGYVRWKIGGIEPFRREYPEYLYMITFLVPEMLAILRRSPMHDLSDKESLIAFAKTHACEENGLSSASFKDGYSFHVLKSTVGVVVGWLKWPGWGSDDQEEGWRVAICDETDLISFAPKLTSYFESLLAHNQKERFQMPSYWKSFIEQHGLVARGFSIPEEFDLSGVGAEIEILDEQICAIEQTQAFPGVGVFWAGYFPVGHCRIGTGDPYFICRRDGEGGPLYRIYHDEVIDENYDPARAIAVVLRDYRDLLKYAVTDNR